jgi:hypothetical protein
MLERLDGRTWHGDHVVEGSTADDVARISAVADGTETDGGLVHRVREFATWVDGSVLVHGFDLTVPRKALEGSPLAALETAPTIAAPRSQPATVRVVSLDPPDGLEEGEWMHRELLGDPGVVLATVAWGDVAAWVPADPRTGPPTATVEQAFLVALAPAERVVPNIAEARALLAGSDAVPGGERGQGLRASGHSWTSVPTVDSWADEASDPWVLGGLLHLTADPKDPARSTLFGAPIPSMTTVVPDGAPVLVASAARGFVARMSDRIITLWEGRDGDDRTVAVALHRSATVIPPLDLPLWPEQLPADPPDGWCGEVMEYQEEDDPEYVSRCRFRITPFGRLAFPSRRIVASDPCVAGRSPALGLELPDEGPFPVLRVDLLTVMDHGGDLDEPARGILVVLDAAEAPVRWEPALDADGQPIDCAIDTGRLLLGDAEGSGAVQRQYDEGTVNFGAEFRLALLRSDPVRPADIAVLSDLGGDGPAWVVIGVAEDGHPVAVMVANFDPLS